MSKVFKKKFKESKVYHEEGLYGIISVMHKIMSFVSSKTKYVESGTHFFLIRIRVKKSYKIDQF